MDGFLVVTDHKLCLQWTAGKKYPKVEIQLSEIVLVMQAMNGSLAADLSTLSAVPPRVWPNALPKLGVTFERSNALSILAVTEIQPVTKDAWMAALTAAPVVEIELVSSEEFLERVLLALDGRDMASGDMTSEQFEAIVADLTNQGLVPEKDDLTGGRTAEFRESVKATRDVHAPLVKSEDVPPIILPGGGPLDGRDRFRNPFHYVPSPPRIVGVESSDLSDLGARSLEQVAGHHRASDDRYTGSLTIRFHVDTPLLVLDHETPHDLGNEHYGYRIARDTDVGQSPIIQPTSARGLIRSIVGAVTNSRFQTMPTHRDEERVGYRVGTDAAKRLVPCRLSFAAGAWSAEMFSGTHTTLTANGSIAATSQQYAAWLPRNLQYRDGRGNLVKPVSGTPLEAQLRSTSHVNHFKFWQVVQIRVPGGAWGPEIDTERVRHTRQTTVAPRTETGVAYVIGGPNRKHDERLFFNTGAALTRPVTNPVIANFNTLLHGYANPASVSDSPFNERSPYINALHTATSGMLCYAFIDGGHIVSLHPALLPRAMHDTSLAETIHSSLHPATSFAQLSPADRMFGWVKDGGSGSFRSRISMGKIETTSLEIVESELGEDHWMPLDVQSSPKNSPRLSGSPVFTGGPHGTSERQELRWGKPGTDNTIRGRKMWVTPTGPEVTSTSSWFTFARNDQAVYQRGKVADDGSAQDNQNRSINSWIRRGSFDVTLNVKNFTAFELGALMYLFPVSNPTPRPVRYRMGFGKSLGFGVVRPELVSTNMSSTASLKAFWLSLDLDDPQRLDANELDDLSTRFAALITAGHPKLLADFDQLRRGYPDNLPLVPPRAHTDRQLDSRGKPDRLWHSLNESKKQNQGGLQTLGDVVRNIGLEFFQR